MLNLGTEKTAAVFFALFLVVWSVRAQEGPAKLGRPALAMPALPILQPSGTQKDDPDHEMGLLLQLTPPAPERLFQFHSEEKVRERIREEFKNIRKVEFPLTKEAVAFSRPVPRLWPFLTVTAEPNYVCYKRLWFEQAGSERYGWDFGILQPFISTGVFYTDLALLPWHWVTDPCRWYDCSAGQCLPGNPVPLLWNPVFAK